MKLFTTAFAALCLMVCVAGATGCTVETQVDPAYPAVQERVLVEVAPPTPEVDVRTVAPSSHHVWCEGYWHWTGQRYIWMRGHWDYRPGWTYYPGRWYYDRGGWRYHGHYWRRLRHH